MTTFVTGFFDLSTLENGREEFRKVDVYIENGVKLLSQPFNFIVFGEENFLEKLKKLISNERVTFIPMTMNDLPVCKILEKDKVVLPRLCNAKKDTYNYMSLMLSKTYFTEEAIKLNPYRSSHFAWIDFGFLYLCKSQGELDLIPVYLNKINLSNKAGVVIPGCQPPQVIPFTLNIKDNLMPGPFWWFCGGFFRGDIDSLLRFNKYMIEALEVMRVQDIITWEVNVWIYVYNKHPELFLWYMADHNIGMLGHFPDDD